MKHRKDWMDPTETCTWWRTLAAPQLTLKNTCGGWSRGSGRSSTGSASAGGSSPPASCRLAWTPQGWWASCTRMTRSRGSSFLRTTRRCCCSEALLHENPLVFVHLVWLYLRYSSVSFCTRGKRVISRGFNTVPLACQTNGSAKN